MAERNWTDEQSEAIYSKWTDSEKTKRANILVNAAAGSGKTAVLVERIIRKLIPKDDEKDVCDITNLLVVTFTNAAAGEMQERISAVISQELTKAIKEKDYKKQKFLKKQISLMNSADITTIDAFCLKTIRSYFHILNIDPNFSIMDSSELELVKGDALEKLFEEMYEKNDRDFIDLICCYTDGRDDKNLADKIKQIYEFIQSFPEPEKWLEEKCAMFDEGENGIWIKESRKVAERYIKNGINKLKKAAEIMIEEVLGHCAEPEEMMKKLPPCEENDIYLAWGSYYTAVYNEYFAMKKMLSCDWDELYELLQAEYMNVRAKAVFIDKEKQIEDKELKKTVLDLRNEAKKMCESAKNYICAPLDEICGVVRKTKKSAETFARLTTRFGEIYGEMKAEQNVMEFSDVEHMCYRLFAEHEEVRKEFAAKYEEILMDEYQDSNRLQDELFKLISRGDNLFMVGDMKQSIYRFRSSDPTIFKEKIDFYEKSKSSSNRKIVLGKNFRSRYQVLDSVNDVFEFIMSEEAGGVDYDEDQRLNTGDDHYENINDDYRSECLVIEATGDDEENVEKVRLEARVIASKIRELKDNEFKIRDIETVSYQDPKSGENVTKTETIYRPVKNKDITILMSSFKNSAGIYMEELSKAGIECYAESKGYFERNEIKLVMALLKIIVNPYCDIPLLGVLRSPIGGFDDDDLVNIRLAEDGYIYSAMKKLCKEYEDGNILEESAAKTAMRAELFIKRLNKWRGYAEYMSSDKLLWTLYEETDIYGFVGVLYSGEESQANLRLLFERAKKYESSGYKGLFNFVRYISLLKKRDEELNSAAMVSENHDVVRIMTIHKSKGLEFPIVFLAGCGKEFYLKDAKGELLLHKDFGFGIDYIDFEKSIKIPGISKRVISGKIRDESVSEEIRKLYVALTRAKEKLIVTAAVKPPKDGWESVEENCRKTKTLSGRAVLEKTHYIDWLMPAALNNPKRWVYKFIRYGDALKDAYVEEEVLQKIAARGTDIERFMRYEYPYRNISDIPSKVSVSDIKNKKDDGEFHTTMIPEPEFLRPQKSIKGAARGTIIHYVMQKIPFAEVMDEEYVKKFVENLSLKGILLPNEVSAVDCRAIAAFYNGDLGRRMRKSRNILRESTFETAISAKLIDEEYPEGENVILQGIIDCCFEEDGEWVIVDYKSDYYKNTEEIEKKYTTQISLYADAMEKITKKSVKNKYLYLFFGNDVVEL